MARSGEPRFVGRRAQLDQLLSWLTAARNGHGSYVTVLGPAGIGKSRLVERLATSPDNLGTTLTARCLPGDPPFAPWSQIVEQARSRSAAGGRARPAPDDAELADRLLELWAGLVPPVLVIIDDLHEADPASRVVLRELTAGLAEEPVVLIATLRAPREDVDADAAQLPLPDHELLLTGLTTSEILKLLTSHDASGTDADLETASRLMAATGGNPLAVTTWLGLATGCEPVDQEGGVPSGAGPVDASLQRAMAHLDGGTLGALRLLAIGRSLPTSALTSLTGLGPDQLATALQRCSELGLLRAERMGMEEPSLHPRVADLLAAAMPDDDQAALHARITDHLEREAAAPATTVAYHALRSAGHLSRHRIAALTERAGWEALERGAFVDAGRYLAAAQDSAIGDEALRVRAQLGRAEARQRSGDLPGASTLAEGAARLASTRGDANALARAAVLYAYPAEWRTGDPVASTLLAAAEAAAPSDRWLAQVLAVRAVVEMRLPIADDDDSQWSWLTRSDTGRPLADRAVELAQRSDDPTATVMALLGWRSTHRAPEFLGERQRASARALQVAQHINRPDLLVEAGLRSATDEIEAGSRAGFEEGLALARWAADRSNEPRLRWRAACLEAARGVLDGDLDTIVEYRQRARGFAAEAMLPGAEVADQLFGIQIALRSRDDALLAYAIDSNHPGATHQLGRAGAALIAAVLDRPDDARRLLGQLPRPLDEESSVLLTAVLAGRAAAMVEDRTHARWLLDLLDPWRRHVAVDSECFWPAAPVAAITAQLRQLLGEDAASVDRALALGAAEGLRSPILPILLDEPIGQATPVLTDRQLRVLRGLSAGRSNAQLALDLSFSVATIRRETSAIYRVLRVGNRAEAVNEAHRLGVM